MSKIVIINKLVWGKIDWFFYYIKQSIGLMMWKLIALAEMYYSCGGFKTLFHNILMATRSVFLVVTLCRGQMFPPTLLLTLGQISSVIRNDAGRYDFLSASVNLIASWSRKKTMFVSGVLVLLWPWSLVLFCFIPRPSHFCMFLLLIGGLPIIHTLWWSYLFHDGLPGMKICSIGGISVYVCFSWCCFWGVL